MEIAELNSQLDQIKKKYKMEVTEQQKMLAEKERAEREIKQRFAYIQSLFNPGEAQVYRKGDNVLISAHGFYFPSGDDEIKSTNFGLLNKLLSSTKQFPNARIGIYGHTDSVGPGDLNLKLSEKRAENVANFIANVGHIPPTKIIHKGFGDTKPIASDKTKEGRTQNRRIEMVIINE
jgi:outer membrane protein OmpA-like peptidoglycan-associated protein